MASPPRDIEREEQRRLNTRTLAVASVASATAAAVTSQLWIHGTWIAAALTPVLVALLSEAIHRPTQRIARARTSNRPIPPASPVPPGRPVPPARPGARDEPLPRRATPGPVPVRVYRQPTGRAPRRRLALGVVAATAAIAFLIAVVAITAADLLAGDSIGKGSGTSTFVGGGGGAKKQQQDAAPEQPAQDQQTTTGDEPATTQPAPEQPPADGAPTPPLPETPPGEPMPNSTP